MKKTLLKTILFSSLALLGWSNLSHAQWTQTAVTSLPVFCLLPVGSDVFVGTGFGAGIRKLSSDGTSETAMNNGLPLGGSTQIRSIVHNGSTMFAAVNGDVFKSTDNGENWVADSVGLPDFIAIWSMLADGSTIYAGTSKGVYFKTEAATSWTAAVNSAFTLDKNIYSLAVLNSTIFAGTGYGIYRSTDGGSNWTAANTGLASPQAVKAFLVDGTKIYVANKNRFCVSTDNGDNWTELFMFGSGNISAIVKLGTNILIAENNGYGVGLSQNEAAAVQQNSGLNYNKVNALAISGGYLFDGADAGGVWKRSLLKMGVVGINEWGKINRINVSPNPSNGKFEIKYNASSQEWKIEIYNMLGEIVPHSINADVVDISNAPKGIYFVKIYDGTNLITKKIIVQ